MTTQRHCCRAALYALPQTDPDFQMNLPTCHPFLSAREDDGEEGKKTLQASCLFTFLCRPLNTTAKAPCPTRSFLLYSKSPTASIAMCWWSSRCWALMDSLEYCSPFQKIILEQMIHWVLAKLLLALRIYFMTSCCSDVPYCINKRCSRDMAHSHAL